MKYSLHDIDYLLNDFFSKFSPRDIIIKVLSNSF